MLVTSLFASNMHPVVDGFPLPHSPPLTGLSFCPNPPLSPPLPSSRIQFPNKSSDLCDFLSPTYSPTSVSHRRLLLVRRVEVQMERCLPPPPWASAGCRQRAQAETLLSLSGGLWKEITQQWDQREKRKRGEIKMERFSHSLLLTISKLK